MVLSMNVLPLLIRQTAVFANRNCRKLSKGYTTPYHARSSLIRQAIEKAQYLSVTNFSRYFSFIHKKIPEDGREENPRPQRWQESRTRKNAKKCVDGDFPRLQ